MKGAGEVGGARDPRRRRRGPVSGSRGAPLPAVLAIDGGNSKTDVALVAADGTLLASARGAGLPPAPSEEMIEVLGSVARQAAGQARLSSTGQAGLSSTGGAGRIARHLSACVANADLPEEERQLGEALRATGWSDTTQVANDTFAVLRAGLDGPAPHWGVAVTCGAGINCVGVAPDGRTTRYLALGPLTGDWGGGRGLGQGAVWWAIRAEDGRGPRTALRDAVAAHFGATTVWDVAVGFRTGTIAADALLGLVPVLFEVARHGDAVALDIVRRQAREVCVMAAAAMRRLGLGGQPVPVVLGGGVLTARDPLLTSEIASRFAVDAPLATWRIVDVPPVAGAALLGLDHICAPPGAEARLRDAYRTAAAPAWTH
jgi:N-acetylglucosamine kinase-like BadF-type ATPase